MKTFKRGGKLLVGAVLIVAGAVAGLNPKWELRKLSRAKPPNPGEEQDPKVVY